MIKKFLITVALFALMSFVQAASDPDKTIREAIKALVPTATIDHIEKSNLPGFYEVVMGSTVVYVTGDGKYLFQGNLFDIASKVDMTEKRVAKVRKAALDKLPESKLRFLGPEKPKPPFTVFNDVDCTYCRRFHQQVDELKRLGIAVHYVFFPLSIHPGADKKLESIWCAEDRHAAYTAAMNGQDPGTNTCDNPVQELLALGNSIGINGTPSLFAEDGSQVGGNAMYSPDKLLAELDRMAAQRQGKK